MWQDLPHGWGRRGPYVLHFTVPAMRGPTSTLPVPSFSQQGLIWIYPLGLAISSFMVIRGSRSSCTIPSRPYSTSPAAATNAAITAIGIYAYVQLG
ncbi:hypothetical protein XELAEV_18031415mg [Xenopus laevis]|uniref:Uncharacterized protein n=1 Tax=Xenopus laevis TaxID=8355 RepID=A0A974CP67_XENLA|nr:hypothetical protein XELAEV_18031415mg [Xenopus laevis]